MTEVATNKRIRIDPTIPTRPIIHNPVFLVFNEPALLERFKKRASSYKHVRVYKPTESEVDRLAVTTKANAKYKVEEKTTRIRQVILDYPIEDMEDVPCTKNWVAVFSEIPPGEEMDVNKMYAHIQGNLGVYFPEDEDQPLDEFVHCVLC